jgi:hypothetical protein
VSSFLESVWRFIFVVVWSLGHDPLLKLKVVDTWLGGDFERVALFFVDDYSALALFDGLLDSVNDGLRIRIDSEEHLSPISILNLIGCILPDVICG